MEQNTCKEKYSFSDFLFYSMMATVPLAIGLLGIYQYSFWGFVSYIVLILAMAAVLCRFFCTHCPHYLKEGKFLKCIFFWGLPKFFKPNPGPYRFLEKAATIGASAVIIGFPVYWLLYETGLLIVYILSFLVFIIAVRRNECPRCIHQDCPFIPEISS